MARRRPRGAGLACLPVAVHRLLCIVLLLLAPCAYAVGLQVAPILLEFGAPEATQALRLSNSSDSPLRAQVRVMAWTQSGGEEQLQPTRDLVASPPIMELVPGQEQLVRIVRLQPGAPQREQAYRLLVDELPPEAGGGKAGVQFLLRHSIPVFVLPPGARPATERRGKAADLSALETRFSAAGDGVLFSVRNKGAQRVRLSQLTFESADGRATPLVPGLLGYVLAGQQMQWDLRLPPTQLTKGTFKARLDDDAEPQALPAVSPSR